MPATPTAAHLRLVAASLRVLAARIDEVPMASARALAMGDTWLGPGALACHDALWHHSRMLAWHVEQLSTSASRLEREADRLDALASAPTGVR